MERLNRGAVAVASGNGVYLSWRVLGNDPDDIAFNVYRNGQLLNGTPLTGASNYVDSSGNPGSQYEVRAIVNGQEQNADANISPWDRQFLTIDLNRPSGDYSPNDLSVADLDGDGDYEVVVKWYPANAKDNSQSGHTDNVYLDAYEFTGEQLWRIDLGQNIRAGAHYTQFMVYDFDGDGKAELIAKTADGTRDSGGTVIGNANVDHRNGSGYILSGPEYLTVFNGETGRIMQTIDYPNPRGQLSSWGDTYGNRMDRFLAGVAYLDGKRPSLIHSRGYYDKAMISALDWRNGTLSLRWTFTADGNQNQAYRGQGAHSLSVADVDGDSRDEIIFGAATIDDNGQGLYSTGLGHGDALHVADIVPDRAGLEVFMVHECPSCYGSHGVEVHDARTGQVLYSGDGGGSDVGRGLTSDIDPRYPGMESWGSSNGLFTSTGQELSSKPGPTNFAIWWDGDLLRELLDGTTISKWDYQNGRTSSLLNAASNNGASNNGTKGNPGLSADILGDWREEVIFRHSNNSQLLLYTTTIPTEHRLRTLMHDPQYRVAIAWQNVAYNQPPHPGFFLGADMNPPPAPEIYYADGTFQDQVDDEESNTLKIEEGQQAFCSVNGVLEQSNPGYSGTGYANTDNAQGTAVNWAINVPQAGEYTLSFGYASVSDRPASLLVNGSTANGNLSFVSTDAWSTWSIRSTTVSLTVGNNHLSLVANGAEGLANIDFLDVSGEGVVAGNCP